LHLALDEAGSLWRWINFCAQTRIYALPSSVSRRAIAAFSVCLPRGIQRVIYTNGRVDKGN